MYCFLEVDLGFGWTTMQKIFKRTSGNLHLPIKSLILMCMNLHCLHLWMRREFTSEKEARIIPLSYWGDFRCLVKVLPNCSSLVSISSVALQSWYDEVHPGAQWNEGVLSSLGFGGRWISINGHTCARTQTSTHTHTLALLLHNNSGNKQQIATPINW